MKTIITLALATFAASTALAQAAPADIQGKMLYGAGGKRLAAVYKVTADGSPQIILDGKLVTVPASSVSVDGGKVTTTLSKKELR